MMRPKIITIVRMVRCIVGECQHEIKVRRIGKRWHCRCLVDGVVNQCIVTGKQQLLHDKTTPIDIANITVAAAQAKKLEAEAKNLEQSTKEKEQQTLKLAEEIAEVKANLVIVTGKQIGRAHV